MSDEELDDFGDKDHILYRIQQELNVQFNTRKQLILKTIYTYIDKKEVYMILIVYHYLELILLILCGKKYVQILWTIS
ncbi:hypothetical protein SD457_10485 [Coprobacillaceae bacterium CR2/5/TPMF4]|nr:hypothetical protein SD457_10485 [Coprobacillaceae bacterium CR2/5/TPMF4]